MDVLDYETQRLQSLRAMQACLLELKWLRDATRLERAMARYDWALKAGFKPDQPRVPKDNPGGGQWTSKGATSGSGGSGGNAPTGKPPDD